jgi:hypothetical protein
VLPYGGRVRLVSLVLVLPEQRRKGYATQLLKTALKENARLGLTSIHDATPAGHEVYVQEGFLDRWGFKRYSLPAVLGQALRGTKGASSGGQGLAAILELDPPRRSAPAASACCAIWRCAAASGAVVESGGRIEDSCWAATVAKPARSGRLVARDPGDPRARLLNGALANLRGPVYVDIADHATGLQALALDQGIRDQRPFTRMAHGPGGLCPGMRR